MTRRTSPLPSDESIRRILLSTWDPLGHAIGHVPDDHYDAYLPGIRRMLQTTRVASKLEDHLEQIEQEKLGIVHADRARRRRAVVLLMALDYPKHRTR